MRRILVVLCFIFVTVTGIFCAGKKDSSAENNPALKVAALTGTSGVGMAYLIENPPELSAEISFEIVISVDVLLPKLLNRDIDIGILPPNVAAKVYNLNKNSITAGAVTGNSMLSLITRDTGISSLSDLAGKTVVIAGQGATPEYVFRTLLQQENLSDKVKLDFSIPNPEIAAALLSGRISYAVVPEPFATVAVSADPSVRRAIVLRDYWQRDGFGDDFPMTLCVIRSEYAEKHPETVRQFLEAYQDSIQWTIAHPAEAGRLAEAKGLGLKAEIAAKAIPDCNFVFIPAFEARTSIEQLLSVFLEYAPESIGSVLPDEKFYFK
ncbi:ABC transporter substrate-binding protein [Brucepastera parasyntrophica]|uniref:ABC transporter substrate-binding protein n=1 Tax=Brucepastera parasyntrophica TaxID=2880008 RepID=UPI00210BFA8C|nr:ABC transporter substrate-binding protein [Brucepastera parasyntrophica]ULQ59995.1 ABC transporter substrate-binding protein [Brucepastera parasyntrophica]